MAIFNKSVEIGAKLPAFSRQLTLEMFKSGDTKTIHNDPEAAKREGLPAPIAVGPQTAALIFKMMSATFEEGWYEGGKASLTFRRPVFCNEFITARGTVREKLEEGGKTRIVCEVWIEKLDGVRAVVGTCSGLVD